MREILFRGKTNSGEWKYGDLVSIPSKNFYSIYEQTPTAITIEVIPETVGQYTGLKDNKGNKIFEGDIVLTQEYDDRPYSKNKKSKRLVGVVTYKTHGGNGFYNKETKQHDRHVDYKAEWRVDVINQGNFGYGAWGDFWDCEVIGNIWDNPELISPISIDK